MRRRHRVPGVTMLLRILSFPLLWYSVLLVVISYFAWKNEWRLAATIGGFLLGLIPTLEARGERTPAIRLGGAALGVIACLGTWFFVPTSNGMNLWTAHQKVAGLVAEIAEIPEGDAVQFAESREARELLKQFWTCRARLNAAETDWVARSVQVWEKKMDAVAPGDVIAFEAVQQMYKGQLSRTNHTKRLRFAEQSWLTRSTIAWEKELKSLPRGDCDNFARLREIYAPYRKNYDGRDNEKLMQAEGRWLDQTISKRILDIERVRSGDFDRFHEAWGKAKPVLKLLTAAEGETQHLARREKLLTAVRDWARVSAETAAATVERNSFQDPLPRIAYLSLVSGELQKIASEMEREDSIEGALTRLTQPQLDAFHKAFERLDADARELVNAGKASEAADLIRKFLDLYHQEGTRLGLQMEMAELRRKYLTANEPPRKPTSENNSTRSSSRTPAKPQLARGS